MPNRMRSLVVVLLLFAIPAVSDAAELERIRVAKDGRTFERVKSGRKFIPWGFNYDHDRNGRLIEDYWDKEWATVEADFREMKSLGANVVRIHLQFGKFMTAADTPNERSLKQLGRLVKLAERVGLSLDVTGLGCYHKKDVPAWYDKLSEQNRWKSQAAFWKAVAARCADSPAIFCYDLMNEPVVPGGRGKRTDWLGPAFAGKHFVQFIALEAKGRPRHEIAKAWIHNLVTTIRKQDRKHLITVGLVPWSLDRPGLTSGFIPEKVTGELDFIAVHLYPEKGKHDKAMKTLSGFAIGKPVIIEETFALKCSLEEHAKFLNASQKYATGWIGFYWGKTPDELKASGMFGDAILRQWLEMFRKLGMTMDGMNGGS